MEGMKLSRGPLIAITVLRVIVGWHFLNEGLTKLTAPSWTAASRPRSTTWWRWPNRSSNTAWR